MADYGETIQNLLEAAHNCAVALTTALTQDGAEAFRFHPDSPTNGCIVEFRANGMWYESIPIPYLFRQAVLNEMVVGKVNLAANAPISQVVGLMPIGGTWQVTAEKPEAMWVFELAQ